MAKMMLRVESWEKVTQCVERFERQEEREKIERTLFAGWLWAMLHTVIIDGHKEYSAATAIDKKKQEVSQVRIEGTTVEGFDRFMEKAASSRRPKITASFPPV